MSTMTGDVEVTHELPFDLLNVKYITELYEDSEELEGWSFEIWEEEEKVKFKKVIEEEFDIDIDDLDSSDLEDIIDDYFSETDEDEILSRIDHVCEDENENWDDYLLNKYGIKLHSVDDEIKLEDVLKKFKKDNYF